MQIFIGSSREALKVAKLVEKVIEQEGMKPLVWDTDFPAGDILLKAIEDLPGKVVGAVLLYTPDLDCKRKSESFSVPVQNVIFEYGYLSARLSPKRVAICQFENAEMPSDLQGMTVVRAGSYEKGNLLDLPGETKTSLQRWLAALPPLMAGVPPISQVHGYSGTWKVQNHFSRWRDTPIGEDDEVSFDGKTFLFLSADGKSGSGTQVGFLNVRVGNYKARYEIVNDVQKASVDDKGTLAMHIKVFRRQQTEEEGEPPSEAFRRDLKNKGEFKVVLKPVPGEPGKLEGIHEYYEAGRSNQEGEEYFEYLGLAGSSGL